MALVQARNRDALRPSEQNELTHFLGPDDARAKKVAKANKRPLKILLCLPTAGKRMIIILERKIEVENAKNVRSHTSLDSKLWRQIWKIRKSRMEGEAGLIKRSFFERDAFRR